VGLTDLGSTVIHRFRKRIYDLLHDCMIFCQLRETKYDFIQIKDKCASAIIAIVASRLTKTNFVYWLSYPFAEEQIYRAKTGTARYPLLYLIRGLLFKGLLYHVILPQADHIFVQSEQMKEDIAAKGIEKTKMTTIPMGVDAELLSRGQGKKTPDDLPEKVLVYLGTLVRSRRLDFLIRTLQRVLRDEPDAKLYMVGEGEDPQDKQMLRDEAIKRRVEHAVVFTGFLPKEAALRWVDRADVCLSPYYPIQVLNSTSPTKLIEYMARGKAVVANHHPEQRLVISESGAGICVPYDKEAFAGAILELLKDRNKAKKMGENGRRYVKRYRTYDVIGDLVEKAYFRIMDHAVG